LKHIIKILLAILLIIMPLVIIITSIRIALTPMFVNVEYQLPGFPADDYGFTTEDRLVWSRFSINYLLGRVSHEELVNQRLPDGTPLFNARELDHMLDVQILTAMVLRFWRILLIYLLAILTLSWRSGMLNDFFIAAKRGAQITILLILGILFYLSINFNQLFNQFHQLFFEGDSWLFLLSDNLIRLFPLRFWRDLFIFIGGLSLALSVLLISIKQKNLFDKK